MRTVFIGLDTPSVIILGRQGEKNASEVIWDITEWQKSYGTGKVTLLYTKEGAEISPYPCQISVSGGQVKWLISPADLSFAHRGKCQLVYSVGNEITAKSPVYQTRVQASLGDDIATPPESFTNWVNKIIESGTLAQCAIEQTARLSSAAEQSASSAALNACLATEKSNSASASAAAAAISEKKTDDNKNETATSAQLAANSAKEATSSAQIASQIADKIVTSAKTTLDKAEEAALSALSAQNAADRAQSAVGKIKFVHSDGVSYLGSLTTISGKPVFIYEEVTE